MLTHHFPGVWLLTYQSVKPSGQGPSGSAYLFPGFHPPVSAGHAAPGPSRSPIAIPGFPPFRVGRITSARATPAELRTQLTSYPNALPFSLSHLISQTHKPPFSLSLARSLAVKKSKGGDFQVEGFSRRDYWV
ncbi:hypothetical protein NL676_025516 [Syzygium grande]|nr:hypothetical protein NL676_025516 [Syzygium grande]